MGNQSWAICTHYEIWFEISCCPYLILIGSPSIDTDQRSPIYTWLIIKHFSSMWWKVWLREYVNDIPSCGTLPCRISVVFIVGFLFSSNPEEDGCICTISGSGEPFVTTGFNVSLQTCQYKKKTLKCDNFLKKKPQLPHTFLKNCINSFLLSVILYSRSLVGFKDCIKAGQLSKESLNVDHGWAICIGTNSAAPRPH